MSVVVLDRDGVINELAFDPVDGRMESPLRPEDVRLVPGAAAACRLLQEHGFDLAVASNQPAAAKGKATPEDLDAVHARVVELLAAEGVTIGEWRYCRHRAEDGCDCRKPKTGLMRDLDPEWVVGDSASDIEAGRAVGARTILVEHPGSAHRRAGVWGADLKVSDLAHAAGEIVKAVR